MLEMSAAKSPAIALTGAVSPALPGVPSADGAQIVDFSTVLAGATLAGEAPSLASDMLVQPETDASPAPELLPQPAIPSGKSDLSGNATGKNLPTGKLAAARQTAVPDKAPRKLRKESVELPNEGNEAAPAQDVVVAAKPGEQAAVQADLTAPSSIDPTAAAIAPAPQTASNVIFAAPAQDTTAGQPMRNDTAAKSEPTPTKLQARAPAQTRTNLVAASATDVAVKPAAAEADGMRDAEESTHSPRSPVLSNQPLPLRGTTRTTASLEEGATSAPEAPLLPNAVTAPRIEVRANQPATISAVPAAQVTVARASIAQPTIAPAAIALEPSTPATIPHLQTTAAVIPSTIVIAPAVAHSAAGVQNASLPEGAEPVANPHNAPELTRATVTTLLAQTAPSALISAAAPSHTAASPIAEPGAEATTTMTFAAPSARTTISPPVELIAEPRATVAPTTAAAFAALTEADEPVADVAVAPRKAAILAATQPIAALPTVSAPASPSAESAAPIKPVGTAQTTSGAEVLTRQAREPSTTAALVQVAQAPAPASAATTATLTTEPATIVSPAPIALDRSAVVAAATQPAGFEAAMVTPVVAARDQEHKVRSATISPATAVEVPATFTRPQMDASTLAAEFRSAPSAPAVTTTSTTATPTQDIAALVDRITEARAAASPHTIRASLVHEDFGAVSVNLRTEASHIHVTLGSADPGFAPAVQAAAAANLAGNSGDDAQNRREAPTPQSGTQPQDGARNDASSQQQAQRERTNAGERQPARQALRGQPANSEERGSTITVSPRRSGVYA